MLWLPRVKLEVVQVAWAEPFSVCAPQPVMVVAPSLKLTVPVGVPEPGTETLTVAVKVTDWPTTEGLADELRLVDVPAWFTVWVRVALVLVVKLVSPP